MFNSKILSIALASALALGSASAAELLVTPDAAKGGGSVAALDFASEGNAVGVQFRVKLPKGVSPEQVDLSKCTADLPKPYGGQCGMLKGEVLVLVYSDDLKPFPAGVMPIGTLAMKQGGGSGFAVSELLVSDARAQPIQAKSQVAGESSGRQKPMPAPGLESNR